jgi:hypothetical protein
MEKYEQPELDFLSEEDKNDFHKQEQETEERKRNRLIHEDDGLSFDCEYCQDQGCPQCGWGRNKAI